MYTGIYTCKGRSEDMQAPANIGPAVRYCKKILKKKKKKKQDQELQLKQNIHVRGL